MEEKLMVSLTTAKQKRRWCFFFHKRLVKFNIQTKYILTVTPWTIMTCTVKSFTPVRLRAAPVHRRFFPASLSTTGLCWHCLQNNTFTICSDHPETQSSTYKHLWSLQDFVIALLVWAMWNLKCVCVCVFKIDRRQKDSYRVYLFSPTVCILTWAVCVIIF